MLSWQIHKSGYCTGKGSIVNPAEGKGQLEFYATWILIQHSKLGNLLFDTGYANHFYQASRNFPDRIYRYVTPVMFDEGNAAVDQLKSIGLTPSDIDGIILSHLHADHIAGLLDFPDIPIYCSEESLVEFKVKKGFSAVKKGILKGLFPKNFEQRVQIIKFSGKTVKNKEGLKFVDFTRDGSIQLVDLPGHAKGQMGIRLSNEKTTLFFGADASWSLDTLQKGILPSKITRLFIDDWDDYCKTFLLLKAYSKKYNELMLFTHCPKTLAYVV